MNFDLLWGDFNIIKLDAGAGVKKAFFQILDNLARRQIFGAHHHPAAAGVRAARRKFFLEVMRIIDGNAVNLLAIAQQMIPNLFHARPTAAAEIVHPGVAVVNFQKLVVVNLHEIVLRDGPFEIGMVDVRHTIGGTHRVHILLNRADEADIHLGVDLLRNVQAIHVYRLCQEARGQFLARN